LFCGAVAGTDGSVNGSPMACDVSVFSSEVQGVIHWGREFEDGVEAAGGDVAISAEAEGVGLPVVSGAADELVAQELQRNWEDASEFLAGKVANLFAGALSEGG